MENCQPPKIPVTENRTQVRKILRVKQIPFINPFHTFSHQIRVQVDSENLHHFGKKKPQNSEQLIRLSISLMGYRG